MEGLAEMKTDVEWADEFYEAAEGHSAYREKRMLKAIEEIRSDAFHAGKLAGLADAQEIVRSHATEFNVPLVDEIEKLCESLEKK